MQSNITLHIEKANISTPLVTNVIEPFDGIQKNNSRIIFFILLFLVIMTVGWNYYYP